MSPVASTSNSIYNELLLSDTPAPKPKNEVPKETTPKAEIKTKDTNDVQTAESKNKPSTVDFVEPKADEAFIYPVKLDDAGNISESGTKVGMFAVDKNGLPQFDENSQLIPDPNGKPVFFKSNNDGLPLRDKEGNITFIPSPKEFNAQEFETDLKTQSVGSPDKQEDSGKVDFLADPETGKPGKFKIDEKTGDPVFENGNPVADPNGKYVFYKLNKEGTPLINPDGKIAYVEPPKEKTEDAEFSKKMSNVIDGRSFEKFVEDHGTKQLVNTAFKLSSKTLMEGFSVAIPFTSKVLGYGLKHTVATAVTKATLNAAAKTGSKAIAKTGGKVMVEALAKTGAEVSTKVIAKEVSLGLTKVAVETAAKKILPKAAKASTNAAMKIIEKGSAKAIEKTVEAGVKVGLKRAGAEAVVKAATHGGEKAIATAATKAATEAAAKTTTKIGSRAAAFAPVAGAVVSAGITAYDTVDAIKKWKDPNVSKASKGLAWATVGLDVVSTAANAASASVVLAPVAVPISWVATGLSIGTSFLSDWMK